MPHHEFTPQLVSVFREGYSFRRFLADLLAGTITGIVALPLAVAFAIVSGVSPMQGICTAVIAGFLISVLSGSRVQIGGPTGAFIVIVADIVRQHGISGLAVATVLAGGILLLMGVLRFGSVIRFIPFPVTLGFTSGIAVVIASSQLKEFFGLVGETEADLPGRIAFCARHLGESNLQALGLAAATVIVIQLWPRVTHRIPGSIVAVIGGAIVAWFFGMNVETIGSRFGELQATLPTPTLPDFSFETIRIMLPAALSIALLGAVESLLSAVVADGMTGMRHRPNIELIAQGVANLVTPIFGGIPATGAIARTAVNIRNGGRTPVAGMIHAVALLALVGALGGLVRYIPMCVLAGVLLCVAYAMSEARLFVRMLRAPKSDLAVMLLTFLLTVFLDLTVAIPTGMVMAAFLFMMRMEKVSNVGMLERPEEDEESDAFALSNYKVPSGVQVYEIYGPFFFGAAHKMQNAIPPEHPRVLILRMRNVPAIDATGLFALEDLIRRARKNHSLVILSALHDQPEAALRKARLLEDHENLSTVADIAEGLAVADEFIKSRRSVVIRKS